MKITKTILDTANKIEALEKVEADARREREALIAWLDGLAAAAKDTPPPVPSVKAPPVAETSERKGETQTSLAEVIQSDLKRPTNMTGRIAQLMVERKQFREFSMQDLYRFFRADDPNHKATIRHAVNALHKAGWVEQKKGRGNYRFNETPNREAYENRMYRREPVAARKPASREAVKKSKANKTHKLEAPSSAVTFSDWEPKTDEEAWLKDLFVNNRGEEVSMQEIYEILEVEEPAAKARVRTAANRMSRLGFLEKPTRGVYRTAFESINLRKQVFDCIKQRKLKDFAPADVIAALHVPDEKKDSIRAEVWKMMRAGLLTRNDEGLYSLK